MNASEELTLLGLAKSGDRAALDVLFSANSTMLRGAALRILGNAEDAEDAVQDGLVSAYRAFDRFEGRSRFSTWLTRVVVNSALMRRRSKRLMLSLDEGPAGSLTAFKDMIPDDSSGPEEISLSRELVSKLRAKLVELTPDARRAFELRFFHELNTIEVAAALGVSSNTAKSRLCRARKKLSVILEN